MWVRCSAVFLRVAWFLPGVFALADETAWKAQLEQVAELRNTGSYGEAKVLVEKIMAEAEEEEASATVAEGLFQLALIQYFLNDYEDARATLEIGRTQAKLNNLPGLEADFLSAEGVLEWKLGNLALATPKLEAALEMQKATGKWVNMASISNNLGIIAYSLKDYPEAVRHYEQGLKWLGDRDNDRLRASLYSNLAEVLIPMGRLDEAEDYLYKALAIEEESNEPRNIAYTYFNLGELYSKQDETEKAIIHFRKALDIQTALDDDWATALTRLKYGKLLWLTGQETEARSQLSRGFDSARGLNALSLLRDYASFLAEINDREGNTGLAEYYSGLHEYFTGQLELDTASAQREETNRARADDSADDRKVLESPLQAATILVLCLLITILVLENTRLRKRMREL